MSGGSEEMIFYVNCIHTESKYFNDDLLDYLCTEEEE